MPVVEELRRLGHDVLKVQEAGRAGLGIGDAAVLTDATADQRAVLTHNRADFKRLHRQGRPHEGIVSATQDPSDTVALAQRIHLAVGQFSDLANEFIRIIRPNPSVKP